MAIAVLGGGISGLSAAYYALEKVRVESIVLLEASNRIGGWIRSKKSPTGAVFEQGPRTIRPRGLAGKNTLELLDCLRLTDKVVPVSFDHPAAKNRFIYVGNKLHALPNSLGGLFKINSPFDRPLISIIWNDLRAPRVSMEDESVYSFVERRLGKDVADNLISPLICGIVAGDARQISVNFLMRSLFDAEQKYGSILGGLLVNQFTKFFSKSNKNDANTKRTGILSETAGKKWSTWGLQGGLEQLPQALANNLQSRDLVIQTNSKCERLTFETDFAELMVNGKTQRYSRVVSSINAKDLAELVQEQHPQLAKELSAIPTVTVAVVNLEYPGKVLPTEAFGILVPPKEKIPILGIIFDSCIFPQESSTVLTVMMGGAWFRTNFGECPSKEHLLSVAVGQVKNILGITGIPIAHDIAILKDCISQYVVGHDQRLSRIRSYISAHRLPLTLCGSSYQGVGLNDVILSAKQAVSDIA